jgi:hypothetical protein
MRNGGIVAGLACCAFIGIAQEAAAQGDLAGCWVGKVGSGGQIARVVLQLEKATEWQGTVSVMGRAMNTDTLRTLVVRLDSVTFGYGAGDRETVVATRVTADGALDGALTRAGTSHPLRLARAGPVPDPATALMGYWSGALTSGGTKVLSSGLRFRPAPCGQVYVTFDSPDQGANDLPVTAVSLVGDSLRFAMEYVGGAFEGTVSADGTRIAGTWTQSGNVLELALEKTAER